MRGSAVATIWMSRIAMKSPRHIVVKPSHDRPLELISQRFAR